ncbi:UNVERIFIED_CONTAM: hypothetical protein GTU68_048778 [Idotea baltica]|nr:hypothetical protein [Idotea baltica]
MKLVFILGRAPKEQEKVILEEHESYGDIIVEDFIDSYTNLTLKSLFILKWIEMKCPQVKYVMKTDDDMFINIPNLKKSLEDPKLPSPLLMGNLICNAHPIKNRWSKWYSPSYMFSGKYPNYVSGTAYVFSGNMAKKLLEAAIQTPYFHLEDVYLTGICAQKLGLKAINCKGFSYLKRALNPCIYKDIISAHEVSIKEMKKIWNMLHNQSILEKCQAIYKGVLNPSEPRKCVYK